MEDVLEGLSGFGYGDEAIPPVDLALVEHPERNIEHFETGLVAWCEMAKRQLRDLNAASEQVWVYLDQNSNSQTGRKAVDVDERRRHMIELLDEQINAVTSRDDDDSDEDVAITPLIGRPGSFSPAPLATFLNDWSAKLWVALGDRARLGRSKRAYVEGDEPAGPERSTRAKRRKRRVDTWEDATGDEAMEVAAAFEDADWLEDHHSDGANEDGNDEQESSHQSAGADEALSSEESRREAAAFSEMLGAATAVAASCVYLQQDHPLLGRRLNGVIEETLARKNGPSNTAKQRTRIFVCARRLRVAFANGEISLRDPASDTSQPMWMRALTLVQAVARLNQDALCRLETPNFDLLSEVERERVMSRFYQEGRRATGQWLYMMEQVLGAEGHKEYAEQFAAMLDDYARKNEPPTADQMEH